MSISTGLDWTGNLSDNADKAASSVDRLVQSLRALQSIQGKAGPTSAGLGGVAGGGIGGIGAAAKEANKAVLIQTKSAADLAKIDAKRIADLDVITAKQKAVAAGIAGQVDVVKQRGTQAQALEGARAASKVAAIQAQSDADRNRAIGRVVEGQAKAASAIAIEQNKSAQAAIRATEKAALVEQQGAIKSAQIREKSAADLARINAKAAADMAVQSHRASLRGTGAARAKGAASVAVQGGSGFDIAEAVGGKAGAAIAVGTVAVSVVAKLAELTKGYASAVVEAQKFREDITEAFKTVRSATAAADSTFNAAIQNADKLRIKRADSIATFLDLATKGFNDTKIKEIQGRLLDLTTIDPRASVEGLTKVIGKAAAQGRLNVDILSELSTFGLEQSDVIAEIGKMLKVDDKEVLRRLSSQGGIRGLGVDPILNAIARQTGGGAAGDKAAAKADNNLSSLITRLEDIPSNLLFDVQAGPGLDAIKGVIRDVLGFFDVSTTTGQRTRKVLGDIFNSITEGLFGKRAGDKEGITGTLENILSIAEQSVEPIKEVASAVGTLGRVILALTSGDTSKLDSGTKRIVGVIKLITSVQGAVFDIFTGQVPHLGDFLQPILDIAGIDADASKVSAFINGLVDLISPRYWLKAAYNAATGSGAGIENNPVIAALQSVANGAYEWIGQGASSIGTFFIDGLVNGISSGITRVVSAVKSVASSALTTAKTVLGIASPSKETHAFGEFYSIGMGDGIENKADYVSRAARLMAEDALVAGSMSVPRLGASPAATSRNGVASGERRVTIVLPPGPLVQIVAGPGTNVAELLEQLEPGIRALFIRIMQQVAQEA